MNNCVEPCCCNKKSCYELDGVVYVVFGCLFHFVGGVAERDGLQRSNTRRPLREWSLSAVYGSSLSMKGCGRNRTC